MMHGLVMFGYVSSARGDVTIDFKGNMNWKSALHLFNDLTVRKWGVFATCHYECVASDVVTMDFEREMYYVFW